MGELYQIPGLLLTALCHVAVVYYMAQHRYSRGKFTLFSIIFSAAFVYLMAYGYAAGGIYVLFTYMAIVLELFLYSCLVSREGFPKKCFLFVTYFCLFTVLDNMLKLTVQIFLPRISDAAGYYVAIVLRSIALLFAIFLYKRHAAAIFGSIMDSGRRWWNLAIIALLFYLLQVTLSILNVMHAMSDRYLFFSLLILSFVMGAVYSVVFSNISYMKKDSESALIRQNAENLSDRLSVLQNAEETNRRLRHDVRHHIGVIAEHAKEGNTSAILTYIKQYSFEISEAEVKQYALNQTINSILSAYAGKAEESGIDLTVQCNVPAKLPMKESDLIALLGNLFENALHGCQKSEKKEPSIEMRIRLQNKKLIIICTNTCTDKLKLSNHLPEGKSIGISSILSVCQKYNGNLDYRLENGNCLACAILNL